MQRYGIFMAYASKNAVLCIFSVDLVATYIFDEANACYVEKWTPLMLVCVKKWPEKVSLRKKMRVRIAYVHYFL